MPDEIRYEIHNVPLLGRNLAASRTPRLQPSVPEEYSDFLSNEVARGEWTVDQEDGKPLSAKGQTLEQHLEFTLATRPHWLMPVVLEDEADEVWTSGNMTLRSKRFEQIKKFCGSDAAARVLFAEEAARYGVTQPFTTQIGTKPSDASSGRDDKSKDKKAEGDLTNNPWSKNFRGDEEARQSRIASIIRTGTKFAEGMAKAAGTTIGRPLRK
ncbi:MAG TPA: hypothetical protein VKR55_29460 [Bradyrhizobium sp.]|uniref:hypothetical protein n=1 Tax=Bradyrhizobium sp. TaxID=376 RepID=UPI002CAB2B80|nr:hypothetical protein [Bradyrhizobium sp.]HLZ06267.1 hypothetical protein [Bradyrhizobium sp.]